MRNSRLSNNNEASSTQVKCGPAKKPIFNPLKSKMTIERLIYLNSVTTKRETAAERMKDIEGDLDMIQRIFSRGNIGTKSSYKVTRIDEMQS